MRVIGGFEFVPGVDGMVMDKCGSELDSTEVTINALAFAVVDVELENGMLRSDIAVPLGGAGGAGMICMADKCGNCGNWREGGTKAKSVYGAYEARERHR